jgi:hypothetical protein
MKKTKITKTDYHDFTEKTSSIAERRALNVGDIWMNRARCKKCGDVITSVNQHDFVRCKCGAIFVDGGSWYLRRGGEIDAIEDMSDLFFDIKKDELETD